MEKYFDWFETINVLISEGTTQELEHNVSVGDKYHGYHVLEQFLQNTIDC